MVRTRYAPSPTGKMHVGNLRTALFEYLVAKHNNGTFVLRIEDTDRKRFVEGAVEIIYDTLKITGIKHDEGPDIGGPYGPYVQSERLKGYTECAEQLVKAGSAYYCFCEKDDSEGPEKYDRRCQRLTKEQIAENLEKGMPYVIRQLIPEGSVTFSDLVYGEITVDASELDDQVLIKSDGFPTYNFANVVDDHFMDITHVVRGSEFLSSTPKYKLLYDAFGWTPPEYVHLPLLVSVTGEKLSKRKGSMSFNDLMDEGYLPEVIINFIALLGWSPQDNREIFSLDELVEAFDIKHISKSPSAFDPVKLAWMNGEYFKKMPQDVFYDMALPYLHEAVKRRDVDFKKIAAMVQTRISFLKDIPPMVDFIDELPEYEADLYIHKKMKTDREISLSALTEAKELYSRVEDWSDENLYGVSVELITSLGIKNSQFFWPVRTALSGKPSSPCGATELAALLGKAESIRRLEAGIGKLLVSAD